VKIKKNEVILEGNKYLSSINVDNKGEKCLRNGVTKQAKEGMKVNKMCAER